MKKHEDHFAPAQKGSSGSKAETLYVGGTPASYASPSTFTRAGDDVKT